MQTESIYRFNLWNSFLTVLHFISQLIFGIAESLGQVLTMKENEINNAFDIALNGEKSLKEAQSCIVLEKSAKEITNGNLQNGSGDLSGDMNDNSSLNQVLEERSSIEKLEPQNQVASLNSSISEEESEDDFPEFANDINSSWAEIAEVEQFVNSVKSSLQSGELKIEDLASDVKSTEKAKKKRRRGKKKSSKSKEENETNQSSTLSTSSTLAPQKSPQKNQPKQQKNKQLPKKERDMSNWNAGKSDPNKKFSHSVLKLRESDEIQVGIKPIRQPFGPAVDSNGFSSEYRRSRISKQ